MTGDRSKRAATAAVVVAVAAFAAVQSYSHIYDLARGHGQRGAVGALVPLSVDGLIVAATLVLLQDPAPKVLARFMLWTAIGATVAANVIYGLGYGVLGALISAWPAYAFIGGVEMVVGLTRRARRVPEVVPAVPAASNELPAHLADAQQQFAGDIAAGVVPPIRRIRSVLGVGQVKATEVRAHLNELASTR